jgi:hypothetical protein
MRKSLTIDRVQSTAPRDDVRASQVVYCHPYMLGGDSPVWRFFCPYCQEHHTHSVGEGWRVRHCSDKGRRRGEPQFWGGYYLKLDPRFA